MKATTEIQWNELRTLWEKAVTQSRLDNEYASRMIPIDKPWWKVFSKTKYLYPPIETDEEYWTHYMRTFYPWNELDGFKSVKDYSNYQMIKISVKLLAALVNRADKYDKEKTK